VRTAGTKTALSAGGAGWQPAADWQSALARRGNFLIASLPEVKVLYILINNLNANT
jgi:hypothetical protein